MTQCKASNCTCAATRKGYCNTHYYRIHRNGTLIVKTTRQRKPKYCSVEGCNNKHYAKGLCVNCYMMQRKESNKILSL